MNEVQILTDDDMGQWDRFIKSHADGDIYHTSPWRTLIREVYGHEPVYLAIKDSNGCIRAGLPAFLINSGIVRGRIVSLPCAHYCNPLVACQDDFDRLIDSIFSLMKKSGIKYFELKTSPDFGLRNAGLTQAEGYYSNYVIDLDRPLETIKGTFHKSRTLRVLKRLDKSDLRLRRAESPDDVREFYLLYLGMRRKYGLLPQPCNFFSTMWDVMSQAGNIEILHAEYRGKVISSSLFLNYKDTVYYEYGASDFEMFHLHPTHFLIWTAIQDAHSRGFKRFDFGRTSDDNQGLSEFKSHWGTVRVPLVYYYFPDAESVVGIKHDSFQKKMMNCVIKHSPAGLCQLMGKMLYRSLV